MLEPRRIRKAPGESHNVAVNWEERLEVGETVIDSEWATTSGLEVASAMGETSSDQMVTSNSVSGGHAGVSYEVTNTVVTNQNRTLQETLKVDVKIA